MENLLNATYEIWDITVSEMLVDKRNLEQLLRELPVYRELFGGKGITEPCVLVKGKRIFLEQSDLEMLAELHTISELQRHMEVCNKRIQRAIKKINRSISEINIIINA